MFVTPKTPASAPGNQLHFAAAGLLNRSERVRDRSGWRPGSGRSSSIFAIACRTSSGPGKQRAQVTPAAHGPHKKPRTGRMWRVDLPACGPRMPRRRRRVRDHVGPGREKSPGTVKKCPGTVKKRSKMPQNAPKRSKYRPFCTFCPVHMDILPRPACIPAAFFPAAFFGPSPFRYVFPCFSPFRPLFNLSPVPRAGIGCPFCAFQVKNRQQKPGRYSGPGIFSSCTLFYFVALRCYSGIIA